MYCIFAIAIELVSIAIGWIIYKSGVGVGAQGVIPMLEGITFGAIGLIIGEILALISLIKRENKPIFAFAAIVIPLGVLAIVASGRLGSL